LEYQACLIGTRLEVERRKYIGTIRRGRVFKTVKKKSGGQMYNAAAYRFYSGNRLSKLPDARCGLLNILAGLTNRPKTGHYATA
jgi:hypothetical protein